MSPLTAIFVGEGNLCTELALRLTGTGTQLVLAGTFASDGEAAVWSRAGGRADVVVRVTALATWLPQAKLTQRERDVLTLLGLAYAEIGQTWASGWAPFRATLRKLYAKLAVNNKAEAAMVAAGAGLL